MKSKFYGVLTMLAATMVLALPALNAQSAIVADVPFSFYVGDKAMEAGHYQARSNSDTLEILQNRDNDAAAFLLKAVRIQAKHEQGPMLVFEKCGNQYFLAQVWDGAGDTGIQLPRSKHEKELLMGANGSAGNPELILLAMNRE
jgi:hypothetical protein